MKRRRFKQDVPPQNRLTLVAEEMREKAAAMPPGIVKDNMLRRARQADMASHIDDWAYSTGLQPPK
jgi:hypothetical protein